MPESSDPIYRLEGRVALVTGAASGIGLATAILLARCGADVGAVDADGEDLHSATERISATGRNCTPLVVDVAAPEQIQKAVTQLGERHGHIDIVFANAGINGVWAPLEELAPEEWRHTIEVNLTGTFLTVKYAVPYLKVRGGSVIITSSVNGTRMFSNTGASAYSSSKAGQVAFAKMAALELAEHRIRVNVICPGWIATDIAESTEKRNLNEIAPPIEFPAGEVPLTKGKPGAPEEVAALVAYLASDESRHISGSEIWIDGAESLLRG